MAISYGFRTSRLRSRISSDAGIQRASQYFQDEDANNLAKQVQQAYKRRKFTPIQDKWFRFEEGRYMACPLAVLMTDCFPHLAWKNWNDIDAGHEAKVLALESFGKDVVEGFEHGMDLVGIDHARTDDYKRGFWLGKHVWYEVTQKARRF